eukprot:c452_g1_i1.p1 GENE.c452_g1_i1~~c452_g1_i1.p1  ORF type:complete len:470 (+),score=210.75 c452_g1_i1:55-1410(+)
MNRELLFVLVLCLGYISITQSRLVEDPTQNVNNLKSSQEALVMKDLFGFDENKLKELSEQLKKTDPELVADNQSQSKKQSYEEGFSEEAIKHILEKESTQNSQLLELSEGSDIPAEMRDPIDWKRWNKFLMGEFEAARLDGTLDKKAHSLPEFSFSENENQNKIPLSTNIELGEGVDSASGPPMDKLCGCEISLTPVCGNDGETYPSSCFARCAGLSVSHDGPCLSKTELNKNDNFLTLKVNPNSQKLEVQTDDQTLLTVGDVDPSQSYNFNKLNDENVALTNQEAGVDFPTLSTDDAIQVAKRSVDEKLKPKEINMPFKHIVTHRQFQENLKELTQIADQFADVALDPKMAKCQCHGKYSPVCGKDFKTYPSPCYASCMGVPLRHAGQCHDNVKMEVNTPTSMDDIRDPICFCSLKQKTVCGVNGVSYLNRCFAECEKIQVRMDGPCLTQ